MWLQPTECCGVSVGQLHVLCMTVVHAATLDVAVPVPCCSTATPTSCWVYMPLLKCILLHCCMHLACGMHYTNCILSHLACISRVACN
eukprot:m.281064 g.281064  ORF g.281064 m.281064 type:complete len:88 (+) comp19834_c0_seq8:1197-1460(+)